MPLPKNITDVTANVLDGSRSRATSRTSTLSQFAASDPSGGMLSSSERKSVSKDFVNRNSSIRAQQVYAVECSGTVNIEDIIEFASTVFYVEEESGHVSVDVVRLGSNLAEAAVDYGTTDGSAKAGIKYEAKKGYLEFKQGETRKTIHIKILSNEEFDTTLEFELWLDNARGAVLGKYLHKCHVMVIDDDAFPTNKYKTLLNAGLASEIPYWPLLLEYMYMHLREAGMRRAFIFTLIFDQLSNMKYVWAILLTNYTVDEVLKPPEGEEKPHNAHTVMYVITALSIIPHFLFLIIDRAKAFRRVNGRAISKLQQNLLRKFLNYDESSRSTVSTSDLQMAISRDVPELVEEAFSSVFGIFQKFGLLAVFIGLQVQKIGTAVSFTVSLFCAFPLITSMFLYVRQKGTKKRRDHAFKCQTGLVSFIQETTDCYTLVNEYMQRPSMIKLFAEKVRASNKAHLDAKVFGIMNQAFPPLLTTIMVGSFALHSYHAVLEGGPIGEFLTGCAIWKGIGDCYQQIFSDVRELQQAIAPLENIVFYMNLPVDCPQKMRRNQQLLDSYDLGLKTAEARLSRHTTGHSPYVSKGTSITAGCFTDEVLFAADLLQISARNISFAYPKNAEGVGGAKVLDQASFEIPQGKLVALTGPRGAGKATLLSLIGNTLRPDECGTGELFIPPHLRVLNVSHHPQTISDLDLFENLCFSPYDAEDHRPKRVLAICRRLGMSHEIIRLVEAHTDFYPSEANKKHKFGLPPERSSTIEKFGLMERSISASSDKVHLGTAFSVTKRRCAELMANDGSVLSQTDRCLIHLARAFVTNPDVLILHKPLNQLDEYHARLVLDLLREFVDLRGIEQSPEGRLLRRPRTCIFSVADSRSADVADKVFHVAQGKVSPVDIHELETLQHFARRLFEAMDLNCDNLVNRREFVEAVGDAPWSAELLGVSRDATSNEALSDMFDMLDRSNNGEVDFDDLVQYLRIRFAGALPQVLASLRVREQSQGKIGNGVLTQSTYVHVPETLGDSCPFDVWKVPDVAIEIPMLTPGRSMHHAHEGCLHTSR